MGYSERTERPGRSAGVGARRKTGTGFRRLLVPVALCLGFGLLAGCGAAQLRREVAADRVARAAHYRETIRSLNLDGTYPALSVEAREALERARTALAGDDFDGAASAADESAAASRSLLSRFYRETVVRLAVRARDTLAERSRRDPEDPLTERIPELDGIADRGDRAAANPRVASIRRVLGDLDTVLAVTDGIRDGWRRTLPADEAFVSGTFDLSEAGREALDKLAAEVRRTASSDGGRSDRFRVKAVGYTDPLNFGRGTRLAAQLADGVAVPDADPERRRFLNRRLSRFRADAAARYLADRLRADGGPDVTAEAVGRGEDLPADVLPPYPAADPRRRICRVFVHRVPR